MLQRNEHTNTFRALEKKRQVPVKAVLFYFYRFSDPRDIVRVRTFVIILNIDFGNR
jgi:hypothetical protein